jgi:hypothetical protein
MDLSFSLQAIIDATSDRFDEHLQTSWSRRRDDFLINVVAITAGLRNVTRLPIVRQSRHKNQLGRKPLSKRCLKDLVDLSWQEDPDGIANESNVDFQRIATARD